MDIADFGCGGEPLGGGAAGFGGAALVGGDIPEAPGTGLAPGTIPEGLSG